MHEKYKNRLNLSLIKVSEDIPTKRANEIEAENIEKKKSEENEEEEVKLGNQKGQKIKKKMKVRSLKKMVEGMSQE